MLLHTLKIVDGKYYITSYIQIFHGQLVIHNLLILKILWEKLRLSPMEEGYVTKFDSCEGIIASLALSPAVTEAIVLKVVTASLILTTPC